MRKNRVQCFILAMRDARGQDGDDVRDEINVQKRNKMESFSLYSDFSLYTLTHIISRAYTSVCTSDFGANIRPSVARKPKRSVTQKPRFASLKLNFQFTFGKSLNKVHRTRQANGPQFAYITHFFCTLAARVGNC